MGSNDFHHKYSEIKNFLVFNILMSKHIFLYIIDFFL